MGSPTTEIEDDHHHEIAGGTIVRSDQSALVENMVAQPQTPEEARAQIEQTRAEMSETIDALKEKLAPENLMMEAKQTAKETVKGMVEGAVEATKESVSHIVEATKETVSHISEKVSHLGGTASVTATHLGSAVKEAVGTTSENVKHAATTTGSVAKGAIYMVSETIRNNPLPTAIVGGTLIFLFLNGKKNGSSASENTWTSYAETHPTSEQHSAISEVREKVSEVAGNVRETVTDAANVVGDKVSDTVSTVKHKVSDVASDVGAKAQHQATRAKTAMEENPLMVGAAVLALGAAIGLMIPVTEQENRLMGSTRDHLLDQANEKAGAFAQKAGVVAQKTLDAINENAREVLTTTKESARNAFDTVKATASDAVDEIKDNNQNEPIEQFQSI